MVNLATDGSRAQSEEHLETPIENLEMHHLEAIVVKQGSWKAESPPWTLGRTSRNIQTEFMRKCSFD